MSSQNPTVTSLRNRLWVSIADYHFVDGDSFMSVWFATEGVPVDMVTWPRRTYAHASDRPRDVEELRGVALRWLEQRGRELAPPLLPPPPTEPTYR